MQQYLTSQSDFIWMRKNLRTSERVQGQKWSLNPNSWIPICSQYKVFNEEMAYLSIFTANKVEKTPSNEQKTCDNNRIFLVL